jgi:hypothetical protein
MRFIESPPALKGENDSHIGWTSLRGAGHQEAGFNHHLVKPVDYDLLVSLFSKPMPPTVSHIG